MLLGADAKPMGAVFNLEQQGSARFPSVVGTAGNGQGDGVPGADGAGGLLVAYDRLDTDSGGRAVLLAKVDIEGKPLSTPMLANWYEAGDQHTPFLVRHPATQRTFAGWQSTGQDASGEGVFFRVLP